MFSQKRNEKSKTLKIFNIQIQDFFKEIILYFPNVDSIKSLNKIIETLCKYNPVKLINIWFRYISLPYSEIIEKGDFNYFEHKNYTSDLADLKGNAEYVLQSYNKLRIEISKLNHTKKMSTMKNLQILTRLSKKYFE
jgi:hypothetical protein